VPIERRLLAIAALFMIVALAFGLGLALNELGWRFVYVPGIARENAQIRTADDLPLGISVWRGAEPGSGRAPAVLFLHGLVDRGIQEPLYGLLCAFLAEQGFVVAAPWLRGYEGATDPGAPFTAARWSPLPDVAAGFQFLAGDRGVDPGRIIVMGHSTGGGYALAFGRAQPAVAGIVSLSRLDLEGRVLRESGFQGKLRGWFSTAFGFDALIGADAFAAFAERDILVFDADIRRLRGDDHPPVLLAIGAFEEDRDRSWLERHANEAGPSVIYLELPESSHMLGVTPDVVGISGLSLYQPQRMEAAFSGLVQWIRDVPVRRLKR
jgi:acetyl esterase/lipase